MSKIVLFFKKYKDKKITIFLFVFFVSILSGFITVKIAKQLPMFESEKSAPDFFMNQYFKWSVEYSRFKPFSSVVLLEAKDLSMNDLALMLECLDSMQPKVIALDILHEHSQDDDSAFLDALINCKSKLVLPIAIDDNDRLRTPFYFGNEGLNDSIFGSVIFDDPWHKQYMHNGFPSFAYFFFVFFIVIVLVLLAFFCRKFYVWLAIFLPKIAFNEILTIVLALFSL